MHPGIEVEPGEFTFPGAEPRQGRDRLANGPKKLFARLLVTGPRSSVVEHFLGKEEAAGSIPAVGSIFDRQKVGASRIGGLTDLGE